MNVIVILEKKPSPLYHCLHSNASAISFAYSLGRSNASAISNGLTVSNASARLLTA
jgi:hypothetical protein